MIRKTILTTSSILLLFACKTSQPQQETEIKKAIGYVVLNESNCGAELKIETEGQTLLLFPENLEEHFKRDGVRLRFSYHSSSEKVKHNCSNAEVIKLVEVTPIRQ